MSISDRMGVHVDHGQAPADVLLSLVVVLILVLAAGAYAGAVITSNRRGQRKWPVRRSVLWVLGLSVVGATMVGPLAEQSHTEFAAHMATHLLIGMLAPLLLVLAAPVTLTLRTLPVRSARRLSRVLKSRPARAMTHPIPAALINGGSLWALYATPLNQAMVNSQLLHTLLLVHFFIAGYLFTVSMVGVDPAPHRASFRMRLVVLLAAISGHSNLAKHIYGQPPAGTTAAGAEAGGVLMFYGGDVLELALIVVMFSQWYEASRPREVKQRLRG